VNQHTRYFSIEDNAVFKNKMLNWANRFNIFCFLDNNAYDFENPSFECMLAAGSRRVFDASRGDVFHRLKDFYDEKPGWLFGHFGYELKQETEKLDSRQNKTGVDFGPCFFFEPEYIVRLKGNQLTVTGNEKTQERVFREIEQQPASIVCTKEPVADIKSDLSKEQYIDTIRALQEHIHRGDCYEINFCQHFFAENSSIDPLHVFSKLTALSPNPFSALYKINHRFCLCASPERYLKKTGRALISQPIKGTSKRNLSDASEDQNNKTYLLKSPKEKSENVMIVDLVRNDLSKIAEEGSVYVKELFGIYSFPQVHQMISTVSAKLKKELHWTDAVKATFPMGSMTGAPKKRVMELIDEYEDTRRGLFSGSIGYVTPDADFDFNVVIRSIFYDEEKSYTSFFAGSGITYYCNAADEYEECLLKAAAMINVLK
jgi:para-aminobenzoate synthetase component I